MDATLRGSRCALAIESIASATARRRKIVGATRGLVRLCVRRSLELNEIADGAPRPSLERPREAAIHNDWTHRRVGRPLVGSTSCERHARILSALSLRCCIASDTASVTKHNGSVRLAIVVEEAKAGIVVGIRGGSGGHLRKAAVVGAHLGGVLAAHRAGATGCSQGHCTSSENGPPFSRLSIVTSGVLTWSGSTETSIGAVDS